MAACDPRAAPGGQRSQCRNDRCTKIDCFAVSAPAHEIAIRDRGVAAAISSRPEVRVSRECVAYSCRLAAAAVFCREGAGAWEQADTGRIVHVAFCRCPFVGNTGSPYVSLLPAKPADRVCQPPNQTTTVFVLPGSNTFPVFCDITPSLLLNRQDSFQTTSGTSTAGISIWA